MSTPWMIATFTLGALLGGFYFGGLWLTVRQLSHSRQPALLLLISFAVRISVVLLGFYTISGGRWEPIVASMFGFLIVRTFLVGCLGDVAQLADPPSSVTAGRTSQ